MPMASAGRRMSEIAVAGQVAKLEMLLHEAEEAGRVKQREADAARMDVAIERAARETSEQRVAAELAHLNDEVLGLRNDLSTRDAEIAKLTMLLRDAEETARLRPREANATRAQVATEEAARELARLETEVLRLRREADAARRAFSTMLGKAIWAAAGYAAEAPPGRWGLRKLCKRLRDAGIVDADWYLEHNKDVAKAGIDPLAHFIRDGFAEGRAPIDFSKWT